MHATTSSFANILGVVDVYRTSEIAIVLAPNHNFFNDILICVQFIKFIKALVKK